MCFRRGTWLPDARRDVLLSSQASAAVASDSTLTRQLVLDANHNADSVAANKWLPAVSGIGDAASTQSASPAVSELVDKGAEYLRDRIFNRDSGKLLETYCWFMVMWSLRSSVTLVCGGLSPSCETLLEKTAIA